MRFAPRSPRRSAENIVPLINVVFLLLVFFMLTGTLRPPPALDVELPRERSQADRPVSAEGPPTLAVAANGDLALEGTRLDRAELDATLRARAIPALAVRADAAAPARVLLPVLETLEARGVRRVDLVTDLAP